MKKILFLLTLVFCFSSYAQQKDEELIYMIIENFTYQPNTSKLKFDLVIKNNSDKTLYLINPKKYFFTNSAISKEVKNKYGKYFIKPYDISISPYPNCLNNDVAVEEVVEIEEVVEETVLASTETDEDEEVVIESTEEMPSKKVNKKTSGNVVDAVVEGTNDHNAKLNKRYKIIYEVVELPARAFKKYKNIEIERNYGTFCKDVDYEISVNYYSSYNPFDYYLTRDFKKYVKNENKEAINLLFENELKVLKKDDVDNVENFKSIIKIMNGLEETNYKSYTSNKVNTN